MEEIKDTINTDEPKIIRELGRNHLAMYPFLYSLAVI